MSQTSAVRSSSREGKWELCWLSVNLGIYVFKEITNSKKYCRGRKEKKCVSLSVLSHPLCNYSRGTMTRVDHPLSNLHRRALKFVPSLQRKRLNAWCVLTEMAYGGIWSHILALIALSHLARGSIISNGFLCATASSKHVCLLIPKSRKAAKTVSQSSSEQGILAKVVGRRRLWAVGSVYEQRPWHGCDEKQEAWLACRMKAFVIAMGSHYLFCFLFQS